MSVVFGNSESSCYAKVVEQTNRDQPSMSHVYLTGLRVSGSIGLVETDGNCVHVGDICPVNSFCGRHVNISQDILLFHECGASIQLPPPYRRIHTFHTGTHRLEMLTIWGIITSFEHGQALIVFVILLVYNSSTCAC